ncbi:MAG: serine protease [Patescibacteria group bacterium]|jgi:hypothetical protein
MNQIEICKKIKKVIKKVVLSGKDKDGKDCIGWGTAVAVNDAGVLLTANHVVKNYSKLSDPKIIAYGVEDSQDTEYKPRLFDVSFDINMPEFALPLGIDLAILEPLKKLSNISCIELEEKNLLEGEDIIMAGFPDEISPPLNFEAMLNYNNSDLAKNKNQIEVFFKVFMRLIMIKKGMIGGVHKININGNCDIPGLVKKVKVEGVVYWIDNGSNHGASGGPVINFDGKLIGIVCEKGLTNQSITDDLSLKVPSGATMALSHKLISWAI